MSKAPRAAVERLREDGDLVLARSVADDGRSAVLVVTPASEHPAPETLGRLEHEYALRDELEPAWAAQPLALVHAEGRPTLLLADPGGELLARLLAQPLEPTALLRIAIGLASALGRVHARGLVHKDIKPTNALVEPAAGRAWLTGFGVASRLPRERPAPEPPEVIAGTIAYMAPEQTGRMNRSVDSRSDLYALGVTLYEMLTGTLPFTSTDPMELMHGHMARPPVPPEEHVPGIPGPLSALVLKLLAKRAEDRYQTAAGVEADLRRCLAEWQARGRIDPFPLAGRDVPDRLVIPERLYGRERETRALLEAFDQVVADGTPQLVLVSGYSGMGKSSVVHELHRALVAPRGLFAAGKFDQYRRDIPYATLAQAFRTLVRQILSRREAEVARWREDLQAALGPCGQLVVALVPELALVLGPQPPVPDLPPQDAQNRFQMVFRRFLGVFARKEHPLALFLDDLQWLDAATLELLAFLITRPEVRHLLLVGAYRDNEVGPSHPLVLTLDSIRKTRALVRDIALSPLAPEDLGRLVADALLCERARAEPLARLVYEKTGGNPFFAIQFLTTLAEEHLLEFDVREAGWRWNLARIRAKGFTDNVVDLMVGKLNRLPEATRGALQQLACLGNRAEIAPLNLVHGGSQAAMHADLREAVRAGLVLHTGGSYGFLHDHVQEAAYALIPEARRPEVHLRIGRLLAANTPPERLGEHVFEVVNQLNRGVALMTAQDERERVAELNLVAGRRAKAATAYASALTYFAAGEALLPEDRWERRYALAFPLGLHRAECEFLTGDLTAAEDRLSMLSHRAADLVDHATVTGVRVALHMTSGRSDRAIEVGLEHLRRVGIQWAPHPTEEVVRQEHERIWRRLGSRPIEALVDLPPMADPGWRATMEVLAELMPATEWTDRALYHLVVGRMTNLSLEYGNGDASCIAYAYLGLVLGPRFGDYRAGLRFGQLSLDLVEKRKLDRFKARSYLAFGHHVVPWNRHLRTGHALVRQAFDAAQQSGDLNCAAYSCANLITDRLASGDPLGDVQREAEAGLDFARKARFGLIAELVTGQLRLIRTLRGLTPAFGSFDGDEFDEGRFEQDLEGAPHLAVVACWHWIRKLQARVYAVDNASAVAAAEKAQRLLWTSPSFFELAEYHFHAALARAALHDAAPADERPRHLDAIAAHHERLARWAENCPENFADRAALVGAEVARLEGRELDAERLYEAAIRSARAHGFVHNEALAHELAARFYAARGFETIAHAYLRSARYGYLRWGADGKVRQLDRAHPHLRAESAPLGRTPTTSAPVEQMDLATVVKASQAVSSELVPGKVIETLLAIAVEHAGAQRGLLILPHRARPRIEAEATTERDRVTVRLRQAAATPAELPESVLRYVLRTQDSVRLDDASAEALFAGDGYIRRHGCRSILCLPLAKPGRLIGVLYLENRLASHVFTPARIALLELLASQAAVSLENARLFEDRTRAEERVRRAERELRLVIDTMPALVASTHPDGSVDFVNERWREYLGLSFEDVRNWGWTAAAHPEDAEWLVDGWRAALAAGVPFEAEARMRRADGEYRWLLIRVVPLRDERGSIVRWYGTSTDIHDRRQAEEALRRSEAYLAEAQEVSHTGSWAWDVVRRRPIYWSAELFRIAGLDPSEGPPSFERTRALHPPEDWASFMETTERATRERTDFEYDSRLVTPDGSVKYIHVVGHPVLDASGDVVELIGTTVDITERKRAEEALHLTQAELARVSRVLTLGELAASIAHEVNQPLAAISANGQACLRWLERPRPDLAEARAAVQRIIRDGHRASEVLQRIRALSARTDPQKTWLDVNDVVREVVALIRSEARQHRVALRTDLSSALPPVHGDRVQLQQVILNLVVNGLEAMAATADGPQELVIRTHRADAAEVRVAVQDAGVGLEPATAARLFDAFFTTKPGGMGMGLSISRSIVEAHGGRLWASSNAGPGATFQFSLPILGEHD